MAAGNLIVDGMWATVESDSVAVYLLTIKDPVASLTNKGLKSVFLSMTGENTIPTTGVQVDGVIELEPGDSIPIPEGTPKIKHTCKAAESTKLWYIPNVT
jgi:hypothetical protein